MPIYPPGKRDRKHRRGATGKKEVAASLGLTPMVDMFTILVVFLLQNYKSTGEVIQIPKDIKLPQATQTKELKPAHVVTITQKEVLFDKTRVASTEDVKAQKDWLIKNLSDVVRDQVRKDENTLKEILKGAIGAQKPSQGATQVTEENKRKVTIQADKELDYLTIKKVMFSVTEAGMGEINFAVSEKEKPKNEPPSGSN